MKRQAERLELEQASKRRVKSIKKTTGKYKYQVMEDEYQKNVVLPEIERERATLEERKALYQKNYEI